MKWNVTFNTDVDISVCACYLYLFMREHLIKLLCNYLLHFRYEVYASNQFYCFLSSHVIQYMKSPNIGFLFLFFSFKDWLLDDSLHETFEIRKNFFLINLIDFNPLHTFRPSFTGISPLKYVFLPFFISKHISLFLFIATKHDVICKTG